MDLSTPNSMLLSPQEFQKEIGLIERQIAAVEDELRQAWINENFRFSSRILTLSAGLAMVVTVAIGGNELVSYLQHIHARYGARRTFKKQISLA